MNTSRIFKKGVNLLTLASFLLWNLAAATPQGGTVAQGNAAITQSGSQTTVNQTSQNTVINWHGFDTAATESVKFNQPNASSIALNRINSGTPTNFNGSLSANGQVWILNPSGVLFGASSKVDVAGLLVTTHNITDANFMSGNYLFTLDPNNINSKIINNGLITVQDSGIVALIGPGVENNGTIIANLGKVYLSSGDAFVLDMYGDSLINFGSSPAVQSGYVSNSGLIQATGGKVHMTANAAAGVLDNVISMSGAIVATTASTGAHGEIILNGGHAGRTKVTGKLNASDGGMVETSGAYVDLADADINPGVGGTWLLDPLTIDIAAQYGNLIQNELQAGVYVTLSTGVSLATGGTGIIFLNQPITWNTSAALTLMAYSSIFVTAPITVTNGSGALILHADTGQVGGIVSFSGAGSVNSNGVTIIYYHPPGGYGAPTDFSPFFVANQPVPFMTINNLTDLQSVGVNPAGYYLLNADITSGTLFSPVFNIFSGIFDGHDYLTGGTHTINNVSISNPGLQYVGAIANVNSGTIENLVVAGSTVFDATISQGVGGIVGYNLGTIANTVFNGIVVGLSGSTFAGGIAGINDGGTIMGSGSLGTMNANTAGGIVGFEVNGTISHDYSQMSITAGNRGGIIGTASGTITFQYVYYAGLSSGMDAFIGNGASSLINLSGPKYLYSSDNCTSCTVGYLSFYGISAAGVPNSALESEGYMNSQAGFVFNAGPGTWTTQGGLQLPTIIQLNTASNFVLLSGSLSTAAVQTVSLYGGNNFISNFSTDASGNFGFEYNPDGGAYGFYLATTNGATVKGAILKTVPTTVPVTNLNITNNQVTVDGNSGFTSANLAVAVANAPYSVSVNDLTLNSGISFLTTPITPYTLNGNITTSGSGNLTFGAPVTLGSSPTLTTTSGIITFNSTVNDSSLHAHTLTLASSSFPTFASAPGGSTRLAALNFIEPAITVNSTVAALVNSELNKDTTVGLTATSGDITINSLIQMTTVFSTNTNLVLTASGDVHINADINLRPSGGPFEGAALVVTAATLFINTATLSFGGVGIGAGLTLTGFLFHAPVVLQSTVTFNGDAYNEFFSTIKDATPGAHSLTLNLGGGLTYFDADIGGGGNALASFTQSGSLDFNGIANVTTTGTQIFNNNILFVASTTGTFTGSDVYFNNGINVQSNSAPITVNGNAHFTGTVNGVFSFFSPTSITVNGNTFIPNAGANLTSQGTINFNGNVNSEPGQSGALTTNAPNTEFGGVTLVGTGGPDPLSSMTINSPMITLNGGTIIQNNQNYGIIMVVTALNGVLVDAGTTTFTNTSTIRGPGSLSVQGNAEFGGVFDNVTQINNLLVTGSTIIDADINTSGTQRYMGSVIINGTPSTLAAGSDLIFDSTIDGPGGLIITTPGSINFEYPIIGQTTNTLSSIDFSAGGFIEFDSNNFFPAIVHTTGNQKYTGEMNLVLFNDPGINFQGAQIEIVNKMEFGEVTDVTFTGNLLMDAGSDIGFNNIIDRNILVTGSSTLGGSIYASNNETFVGPVTASSGNTALFNTTTGGGDITFQSTIEGPGAAFISAATGSIIFDDTVGFNTALSSLAANAMTSVDITQSTNTTSFTTTGGQSFLAVSGGIFLDTLNSITFTSTGGSFVGFSGLMDSFSLTTPLSTSVVVVGNLFFTGGGMGQNFNLPNYTSVNSLDVQGPSFIGSNGNVDVNIRTLNAQLYEQSVQLDGNNQNFTAVNGASGTITFQGILDGSSFNTQNFTVIASGIATFNGAIGDANDRLASLSITGSQIILNTPQVITAGNQDYFGPVTLQQDMVPVGGIQTQVSNKSITFHNTIDGAFILDINKFNPAPGIVTFDGAVNVASLDVTGTAINLNAVAVNTTGGQTYNGPVMLSAGPTILTDTTTDITFNSTVDGPGALSVMTPGNIYFYDAIGNGFPLSSLTTTSGPGVFTFTWFILSNLAPSFVITTGNQTYTGTVDLQLANPAITFQGSQIEIKNLLISGSISDVTIDGNLLMDLNSNVGGGGATIWSIDIRNLTVTGSSIIGGEIRTSSGDETFMGPVQLNGSTIFNTQTAGNIIFQSTIEGPGSAYISALGSVYFNDTVGFASPLASLAALAGADVDIKNSSNTTSISASGPIDIQSSTGRILLDTLNSITFNSPAVDFAGPMDSYSATTPLPTDVVINGNLFYIEGVYLTPGTGIGENYNLSSNYTDVKSLDVKGTSTIGANVNSNPQDVNIRTLNDQTYEQGVTLGGVNQNFTSANGKITFQGTFDGDSDTQSFTAVAAGVVEFDGAVGSPSLNLINLDVTGSQIIVNTSQLTTAGYQDYHSPVMIPNIGAITFTGTNIIFERPVESSGTPAQITITGNLVVGNSSSIGAASDVSSLTISGTTRDGGNITTTNDPIFGGAYFLTNDVTITDLSVVGITFGSTVDNDAVFTGPWNLTLNVSAGTVTFGDDVGTANGALNSLTVNGTSSFNKGSLQTVNTRGSQLYSNTVTLNNDVQLFTLDPGPLGTSIVSFGSGAAGVSGPAFNLTVVTNNPANGPTGAGVTGTVDVNNLTVGGPGGANLSSDYPTSESFVTAQGAGQAISNTTVSPDFSPTAFYCVNNFCTLIPVPPTPPVPPVNPFPVNVPPTQIFGAPNGLVSCDASGCTNLELIMENFAQVGTVTCVLGFAEAVDEHGSVRILMPGSTVYAGEHVSADAGSMVCVKPLNGEKECVQAGKSKTV